MSTEPHREMRRPERLVHFVQELERLVAVRALASESLREGFAAAKADGFDTPTLKVVLKLRKMTPGQRRERRALESIYMAALGMLDGDPLTEEARRRLDPDTAPPPSLPDVDASSPATPHMEQPPLIVKDPDEARAEGSAAAEVGQRIYDNPYPAGDPCRAAWDEGWCAQRKSHGMEMPEAYQRRQTKPEKRDKDAGDGDAERGAA